MRSSISSENDLPDQRRVKLKGHALRGGYAGIGKTAMLVGVICTAFGVYPLLYGLGITDVGEAESRVSERRDHDGSERIVGYRIYEDRYSHAATDQVLTQYSRIPVTFHLPVDDTPTCMSRRLPTYWEVVVRADTSGIDF